MTDMVLVPMPPRPVSPRALAHRSLDGLFTRLDERFTQREAAANERHAREMASIAAERASLRQQHAEHLSHLLLQCELEPQAGAAAAQGWLAWLLGSASGQGPPSTTQG